NPGALFQDDVFYTSTSAMPVNLQAYLPLVSNDQKWVALLVRGAHQTDLDNRMFETDVASGATVQQQTPVADELFVQIVVQDGLPSPTPLKPSIAASDCCLAFVLLTATGIAQIVSGEGWRLKTLFEVEGRVTVLEAEFSDIEQRTSTLETDIANIAGQLKSIPRIELMRQIQTNLCNLNVAVKLPAVARAYWEDLGLFDADWDTTNASWLARIWTGVRFPWASITNNQLSLLTAGDPLLTITNKLALPAWTEKTRISVEGADGYKDISQQVHSIVTAVENTVARTSVSYGPTINVCTNAAGFAAVAGTEVGQTFTANGQTYVNDGLSSGTGSSLGAGNIIHPDINFSAWNSDPTTANHRIYAVQELQIDSWTETYWSYVTNTYGVNGSIYGQTFLNSQATIATSVDLYFTRVDATGGDVHLFLCETTATGEPNWSATLANVTVPCGTLHTGWNKFPFTPTLLDPGKLYAWFTVTVGNHALATVNDNKYAQGSLFWSTDGKWAQGDPTNDFAFRLNAASFATTRTVVNFQPLALENGMTEIKLLYGGWAPGGTSLVWEILPVGSSTWSTLIPKGDTNPLVGLPPLCQLRATFVGTTDLMPAILLDTNARAWAGRMQGSMTAPSKQQAFGYSSSSVTVVTTVDNFDGNLHTFTNKLLLASGAIVTPSVTSTAVDPNKSTRVTFTSTFALGAPQTSAAVMPCATTSTVVKVPFVQDILMFAA
ncbi:hypothetical protein M2322_004841, partial [Rhodoblastus acidophilus]|uniref:hypothetical protein n=1 Tax=Rhodoblastus acidophilus TaxID=1074 RepID=UPI002225627C